MYTTKKKVENRLDLWYTDPAHNIEYDENGDIVYTEGPVKKCFVIRQSNPNDAYDPISNTLTFDNAEYCIVAIRDGTGEHYKDYAPASAVVEFSYQPLPED